MHYFPRTAILNNLEFDHADIFPDLGAIETQFHHLVRIVPRSGRVVATAPKRRCERVLARGCWSPVERFGSSGGWNATAVTEDATHGFDVVFGDQGFGRLELPMAGAHNRCNALAAIAAARHVGVAPALAIEALVRFQGVKRRHRGARRTRRRHRVRRLCAPPDGHRHDVDGLRRRVGKGRILAVLEPRSNTMKLGAMKAQLPGQPARG